MKVDAIVIGGGPAGSISAMGLAKLGLSVVLLEKRAQITRKVCGEYLCPRGVDLLEALELRTEAEAMFSKVYGMNIYTSSGTEVLTEFPTTKAVANYGLSLNRETFDNFLLNKAIQAGVTVKMKETFSSIERRDGTWCVQTSNGEQIQGNLLVGADGRNSSVAKSLSLFNKVDSRRLALHVYFDNTAINYRKGEMHLFKDGSYIGIDPTTEREINLSLVCDRNALVDSEPIEVINKYITESNNLYRRFKTLPSNTKVYAVSPITSSSKDVIGSGAALVGDASGFIDPLTGEGIYNAIRSAHMLVSSVSKYANNTSFNFQRGLKDYRRVRKTDFREKNILNHCFQWLIRRPYLVELVAKYVNKNTKRRNIFVGIIGNIYSPAIGILKLLF